MKNYSKITAGIALIIMLGGFLAACGATATSTSASTIVPTNAPVSSSPTVATSQKYDFSAVTKQIESGIKEADLPGASLLVVKDGQVIYQQTFGSYNLNTVVSIASATKWLSAAAIMTLVDEGKLKLDDLVSKYLPNFTGKKANITLRQLLSHTSGLPGEVLCLGDFTMTLAACVDQIAQVNLIADPGAEFRYGGVSMQVAGRIAEVVSGKAWAQFFEERIATPLDMKNTRYGRLGKTPNPQIAGGASSTLLDYANFLRMILAGGTFNGKRVLSAEVIKEMQRDQTNGAPFKAGSLPRQAVDSKYGLGEWQDLVDPQGNPIEVSSPGAFGFRPWVNNQQNLLGVFLIENKDKELKKDNLSFLGGGAIQTMVREIVAK